MRMQKALYKFPVQIDDNNLRRALSVSWGTRAIWRARSWRRRRVSRSPRGAFAGRRGTWSPARCSRRCASMEDATCYHINRLSEAWRPARAPRTKLNELLASPLLEHNVVGQCGGLARSCTRSTRRGWRCATSAAPSRPRSPRYGIYSPISASRPYRTGVHRAARSPRRYELCATLCCRLRHPMARRLGWSIWTRTVPVDVQINRLILLFFL